MPHVSPAAFSSLCLGISLPLCPMSAQQPPVPSVLGSPCRCAPGQPSSLQFPLSWALLVAVPQVSPVAFSSLCLGLSLPLCPMSAQQPPVPSVLGSPCRCAPGQPSSLQFPLSWALLVAVPQVSPAAFSSLCLGLSLPLCPRSAQQPSVPSVLGSPCRCAPCQPSSLQFPLYWALLAAVPHVSPVQPPVLSVLGSPCRCAPCHSLQFPLSWALLVAVPHVSPAASSSLCIGLSLPLCPMSAQQPPVPSVFGSPCRYAPGQPSSLQFPLYWALLAAVSQVSQAASSSLCLGLSLPLSPMSAQQPPVLLPWFVSHVEFRLPLLPSPFAAKLIIFSLTGHWSFRFIFSPSHFFKSTSFPNDTNVLLCSLVEPGIGDGLTPIHLQCFPQAGATETISISLSTRLLMIVYTRQTAVKLRK